MEKENYMVRIEHPTKIVSAQGVSAEVVMRRAIISRELNKKYPVDEQKFKEMLNRIDLESAYY